MAMNSIVLGVSYIYIYTYYNKGFLTEGWGGDHSSLKNATNPNDPRPWLKYLIFKSRTDGGCDVFFCCPAATAKKKT